MLQVKNPRDLGAAITFIVIGSAGMWFGREYDFGEAARMGPGYFPIMVSGLLVLIGIVVGAQAFAIEGVPIERFRWRSVLLILAAVLCFGALIEVGGLATTIVATVAIAAFATHEAAWKGTLGLAVFLAAFCVIVFVYALGQPIPIFGAR